MGERNWGRDRSKGNSSGGGSSRGRRSSSDHRGEGRRDTEGGRPSGGGYHGERRGYNDRPSGGGYRGEGRPREGGERRSFGGGERRDYNDRPRPSGGSFHGEGRREGTERRSFGGERRGYNDRPSGGGYRSGDRGGYRDRPSGDREGGRPSGGGYRGEGRPREGGERRDYNDRPRPSGGGYRGDRGGGRSFGAEKRPFGGGERSRGSIGFKNQERKDVGSFRERSPPEGEEGAGRFDRAKFMQRARAETSEVLRSRDMYLALLSNCIEEEERVANQLGERLEEIYGLYFPELDVENKRNYALIVNMITKQDVPIEAVGKYVGEGKARQIADAGRKSVGGNFNEKDLENMKKMAQEIESVFALMNRHEKHMDDVAREECPNLHYLVGAKLSGKLISVAGGMKKLAVLPASTIQVMGAEKALFKHLRNRNIAPPKHGVIFQHPAISTAPKGVRGKIARALATKIALAAKADVYTKRFIGPMIKEKFDKRLKEINENAARARGRHEDEDTPSG